MLFYVSPEHENFTTENAKAEKTSKRGQSLIEAIISHLNEIKFWFIPSSCKCVPSTFSADKKQKITQSSELT